MRPFRHARRAGSRSKLYRLLKEMLMTGMTRKCDQLATMQPLGMREGWAVGASCVVCFGRAKACCPMIFRAEQRTKQPKSLGPHISPGGPVETQISKAPDVLRQYSARPRTRMKIEFWGFRCQKNENGRWEFCIRVIKLFPGSYRI